MLNINQPFFYFILYYYCHFYYLKFKERDSYVELWQNACSELEKLQEIERVCFVFLVVDEAFLNFIELYEL